MARLAAIKTASLRFGLVVVAAAALVLIAGTAYSALASTGLHTAVTSAFFIGGAVLVVGSAASGGGVKGRRSDVYRGGVSRIAVQEMPFGWLIVGLCLIGFG